MKWLQALIWIMCVIFFVRCLVLAITASNFGAICGWGCALMWVGIAAIEKFCKN